MAVTVSGFLFGGCLISTFVSIGKKIDKKSKLFILFIILDILTVFIFITLFYVDLNGRYQLNPVNTYDGKYPYFGQTVNNLPDGFGKYFNSDHQIVYLGEFRTGNEEGKGTVYAVAPDGTVYIEYEGDFWNGKAYGEGTHYVYVHGESKIQYEGSFRNNNYWDNGIYNEYNLDGSLSLHYEGDFVDGVRCGSGLLMTFYGDEEILKESFIGSWAYDKRFGYGIQQQYSTDGQVFASFQGVYVDNNREGHGVEEFTLDDGTQLVFNGIYSKDERTEDGCYYKRDGNIYYTELNGTLSGRVRDRQLGETLQELWPFPADMLLVE